MHYSHYSLIYNTYTALAYIGNWIFDLTTCFYIYFNFIYCYLCLFLLARISGASEIAQKYISQARVLSGDIYDCFEVDAGTYNLNIFIFI